MGFLFSKKSYPTSFILNTQFLNGVGAGAVRTFDFWHVVLIHNIWISVSSTAVGAYTFNFRTVSTTNNPFVKSSSDTYTFKRITFNSWLLGINVFSVSKPIQADYFDITNTLAVPVGQAVNVMVEIEQM